MSVIQINGFTDLHTHVLPAVDDGAQSLQQSMQMIRLAWANGTRTIFLTPHYRGAYRKNTPEHLQKVFSELCKVVAVEFPEMRLFLGSEIYYGSDVPEKLEVGQILSLNHSRYALIEFQSNTLYSRIVMAVSEVIGAGFIPVVAHIERYAVSRTQPELVDELIQMGALIQMNADSILGKHGFGVKQYCHRLLKNGKVHFIGSDAHNTDTRPPLLRECFWHVYKKYGPQYAARVFYENAQAIVENREIGE